MIKKFILSLALTFITVCSVTVFAEETTISMQYSMENGVVTVTGRSSSTVSITLLPDGVSFDELSNEIVEPVYFRFVEPLDGAYSHSFSLNDDAQNGKYWVYVSSESGQAKDSFMKISESDVPSGLLKNISDASDVTSMKQLIENNAMSLGVDMSVDGYEECKSKLYAYLFAINSDYTSVSEFYTEYCFSLALARCVKNDDAKAAFEQGAGDLGLSFDADYENDSRLSDTVKTELLSMLKNRNWETVLKNSQDCKADFSKEFETLKALSAGKCAVTRVQLQKVMLVDFADTFTFVKANTSYSKLKNQDKVFEVMMENSPYSTYLEFSTAFDNAVEKVKKSETTTSTSSSGGGGGSGSGVLSNIAANKDTDNIVLPTISPNVSIENDLYTTESENDKFTDLEGYDWATESIYHLKDKGIISGVSDSEFSPSTFIKRGDFILMLTKMLNMENDFTENFDDVSVDSYYYDAIGSAKAAGIASGYDKRFMPESLITREDLVTLAYRAYVKNGIVKEQNEYSSITLFSDSEQISEYALSAMSAMVSEGIINGYDGKLKPSDYATRAEAAVICAKLLEKMN